MTNEKKDPGVVSFRFIDKITNKTAFGNSPKRSLQAEKELIRLSDIVKNADGTTLGPIVVRWNNFEYILL